MLLQEFNYVAEIIASMAVIASLIYVGRQLHHNTEATRATARQAYVDSMNDYVGLINSSPNLAGILDKAAKGVSSLTSVETIQFFAWLDQNFITYEGYYFQWKAGILDARLWSIYGHTIADLMIQVGQQQWWETRRHWFDPEFQEYVNRVIKEDSAKPMHPFSLDSAQNT